MTRVAAALTVMALCCAPRLHAQEPVTRPAVPVRSQWDGIYTDNQADRGRRVYISHCERCHGSDLQGLPQPINYPGQSSLTPPLIGYAFQRNWAKMSIGALQQRIYTSMPADRLPSINAGQAADIVAFILSQAGYPVGVRELSGDSKKLKDVIFSPWCSPESTC